MTACARVQHPLMTTTKQQGEVAEEVRSLACTQPVRKYCIQIDCLEACKKGHPEVTAR